MTPWYIDAMDARAGIAIVTQRSRPDLAMNALIESGPSAYIGPPSFVPEFVSTRSLAFALGRNRAQIGLFHKEKEVSFDTLAAVAEFIRRSYLRGAGGDGPGESGFGPPSPSPEGTEPPDGFPEGMLRIEVGEADLDSVVALMKFARDNNEVSKNLEIGKSARTIGLPQLPTTYFGPNQRHRRLARGAWRVFREIIRRRPQASAASPEFLHWTRTFHRFLVILVQTGIELFMMEEFDPSSPSYWIFGKSPQALSEIENNLLNIIKFGILRFELMEFFWGFNGPFWDTFDNLAILPVPPYLLPFAPREGQNLQSLLSAGIATPSYVLLNPDNKPWLEEEYAELTLFAAAAINLNDDYFSVLRNISRNKDKVDIAKEFSGLLAVKAQTWIGDNLPRFVYAQEVEKMISSASDIPA